jgi:hypothetical protein
VQIKLCTLAVPAGLLLDLLVLLASWAASSSAILLASSFFAAASVRCFSYIEAILLVIAL